MQSCSLFCPKRQTADPSPRRPLPRGRRDARGPRRRSDAATCTPRPAWGRSPRRPGSARRARGRQRALRRVGGGAAVRGAGRRRPGPGVCVSGRPGETRAALLPAARRCRGGPHLGARRAGCAARPEPRASPPPAPRLVFVRARRRGRGGRPAGPGGASACCRRRPAACTGRPRALGAAAAAAWAVPVRGECGRRGRAWAAAPAGGRRVPGRPRLAHPRRLGRLLRASLPGPRLAGILGRPAEPRPVGTQKTRAEGGGGEACPSWSGMTVSLRAVVASWTPLLALSQPGERTLQCRAQPSRPGRPACLLEPAGRQVHGVRGRLLRGLGAAQGLASPSSLRLLSFHITCVRGGVAAHLAPSGAAWLNILSFTGDGRLVKPRRSLPPSAYPPTPGFDLFCVFVLI